MSYRLNAAKLRRWWGRRWLVPQRQATAAHVCAAPPYLVPPWDEPGLRCSLDGARHIPRARADGAESRGPRHRHACPLHARGAEHHLLLSEGHAGNGLSCSCGWLEGASAEILSVSEAARRVCRNAFNFIGQLQPPGPSSTDWTSAVGNHASLLVAPDPLDLARTTLQEPSAWIYRG